MIPLHFTLWSVQVAALWTGEGGDLVGTPMLMLKSLVP